MAWGGLEWPVLESQVSGIEWGRTRPPSSRPRWTRSAARAGSPSASHRSCRGTERPSDFKEESLNCTFTLKMKLAVDFVPVRRDE